MVDRERAVGMSRQVPSPGAPRVEGGLKVARAGWRGSAFERCAGRRDVPVTASGEQGVGERDPILDLAAEIDGAPITDDGAVRLAATLVTPARVVLVLAGGHLVGGLHAGRLAEHQRAQPGRRSRLHQQALGLRLRRLGGERVDHRGQQQQGQDRLPHRQSPQSDGERVAARKAVSSKERRGPGLPHAARSSERTTRPW